MERLLVAQRGTSGEASSVTAYLCRGREVAVLVGARSSWGLDEMPAAR
jgi:hypothetical protein